MGVKFGAEVTVGVEEGTKFGADEGTFGAEEGTKGPLWSPPPLFRAKFHPRQCNYKR